MIEYAIAQEKRVCVSTDTRALQNQILNQELPVVQKILGKSIKAEICFGAGNYVCKRKLQRMMDDGSIPPDMIDEDGSILQEFHDWHKTTETGARPDFEGFASNDFWNRIGRDPDDCLGRKCPNFEISYYFLAKERWKQADLLIINHSLLARHLLSERQLLPPFDTVVVDEAHKFPEAIEAALIGKISTDAIADLHTEMPVSDPVFKDIAKATADRLFISTEDIQSRVRLNEPVAGLNDLIEKCNEKKAELEQKLEESEELFSSEDTGASETELKLKRNIRKLESAEQLLKSLSLGPGDSRVHWVESKDIRDKPVRTFFISPIEIDEFVVSQFLEQMEGVVFCSATLSAGKSGFQPFARRLGIQSYEKCRIRSPFDYENSAFVYLPESMPDVKDEESFHKKVASEVDRLVELTEGGAFVLFTSRRSLQQVADLLTTSVSVYSQIELGPSTSLARFRKDKNGVLLGLATFWQGVDVPGDQLRSVILVRLPFQVPDDPILEARQQKLENSGKSPFFELQLPDAVLRTKQGFGRLIRTSSDYGIISILDPRVTTRSYGKQFLGSLPRMRVIRTLDEAAIQWDVIKNAALNRSIRN